MRRTVTILQSCMLLIAAILFMGCAKKETLEVNLDLSADDKLWVPYSTTGFQQKYYRDETGYVHQLNLMWDVETTQVWGTTETRYHSGRSLDMICFGRTDNCRINVVKKKEGIQMDFNFLGGMAPEFKLEQTELNTTVDSINLWGNMFYDVVVFENSAVVGYTGPCLRLYLCKGLGIVGVEFRDGRYYVLE